jgi:hypothetical protein
MIILYDKHAEKKFIQHSGIRNSYYELRGNETVTADITKRKKRHWHSYRSIFKLHSFKGEPFENTE